MLKIRFILFLFEFEVQIKNVMRGRIKHSQEIYRRWYCISLKKNSLVTIVVLCYLLRFGTTNIIVKNEFRKNICNRWLAFLDVENYIISGIMYHKHVLTTIFASAHEYVIGHLFYLGCIQEIIARNDSRSKKINICFINNGNSIYFLEAKVKS